MKGGGKDMAEVVGFNSKKPFLTSWCCLNPASLEIDTKFT